MTIGYQDENIYKEKGIDAAPVSSEDLNFKKILDGKIDTYRTSKIVGYDAIKRLFTPEQAALFTTHPKIAEVDKYHALFSMKTANGKELADKLDSGIQKLKNSGEYDKILAKYIGNKQ